jgi:hypothetical protein
MIVELGRWRKRSAPRWHEMLQLLGPVLHDDDARSGGRVGVRLRLNHQETAIARHVLGNDGRGCIDEVGAGEEPDGRAERNLVSRLDGHGHHRSPLEIEQLAPIE